MRKPITILLAVLLVLMLVGIAVAVPSPDVLKDAADRHKARYQPTQFSFIDEQRFQGRDGGTEEESADDGLDFDEEEDDGIDFDE